MLNIPHQLATELKLHLDHVQNVLEMHQEGATLPFIARYRKERTGEMNEVTLRDLIERFTYLTELEDRKKTVLKSIDEQGQLTDDLRVKIETCLTKTELEDLYLPFKPKKRTRATIAREKGLALLADLIKQHNVPSAPALILESVATAYLDPEKGVETVADALQGAADIIAEEVAEVAEFRAYVRTVFFTRGFFVSKVKEEHSEGTTKYEMYRDFRVRVNDIAPHNMLALRRGENEGFLQLDLDFETDYILEYLHRHVIRTTEINLVDFYTALIKDGFERLMKHSLIGEVRLEKKKEADTASIMTFEANLRELLLASPAGMKPTLGIDPGFRTGCKVAAVDQTGKFIEYQTIFPHTGETRKMEAARVIQEMIERHHIELIAIGNGTAGRETYDFISDILPKMKPRPTHVIVNESGASVYSASQVAIAEFPDHDLTVRGAISIARRLQDPLAELVKIDPKSIGVGQYQHDVDQRQLKKKLEETVESCVNFVGVDLNLASKELLSYVSGITPTLAKNIVGYRNENGAFTDRQQLLSVPRFGTKAFEQASGFLRIRDGKNPLDNSAVHPESYPIVAQMADDLAIPIDQITQCPAQVREINIKKYVTDTVGEPTLRDIIAELQKPGRDPREEFTYATFTDGISQISDLDAGMELEGVVTNVTDFGAFVDIGVHQDGLVHKSQMANRFVRDPKEVAKVGQVVKVRVLEINEKLKRISLSMKRPETELKGPHKKTAPASPPVTLEDLKNKFGS